MRVLVTGGAGYIGSHTTVTLLDHGHDICVVDNLSNADLRSVERICDIAEREVPFIPMDVRDTAALAALMDEHRTDAVVHFAGFKSAPESVRDPLTYYDVNVSCTQSVLRAMELASVTRLVFSSSCSIYGSQPGAVTEGQHPNPESPYARTKWMSEQIITDAVRAHAGWAAVSLRYFNPIGAHPTGYLGEDPSFPGDNLMPHILRVAAGRAEVVDIYGCDYPTPDGSPVRDFLHVMDLADGHVAALDQVASRSGARAYNLGTGRGTSVLELIEVFAETTGAVVHHRKSGRRAGDVAELVAHPGLARRELGWRTTRSLEQMCEDAWRFARSHPVGYAPA